MDELDSVEGVHRRTVPIDGDATASLRRARRALQAFAALLLVNPLVWWSWIAQTYPHGEPLFWAYVALWLVHVWLGVRATRAALAARRAGAVNVGWQIGLGFVATIVAIVFGLCGIYTGALGQALSGA